MTAHTPHTTQGARAPPCACNALPLLCPIGATLRNTNILVDHKTTNILGKSPRSLQIWALVRHLYSTRRQLDQLFVSLEFVMRPFRTAPVMATP